MGSVEAHLAWMRLRNLAEQTTIRQRAAALRRLCQTLGVDDPLHVTAADLEAWQSSLTRPTPRRPEGASPQTHCTYVTHVHGYFHWAVKAGLRGDDPSVHLVRPKLPRRLPRPISEERLLIAIAAAEGRVRLWLVLAAWCGLRAREIAGVHGSHITVGPAPTLFIADGKGGAQRCLPLPPMVTEELERYGLRRGWMFPGAAGGHVTPGRVSQAANEHLRRLEIPDTLHSLRHRFGTELYRTLPDLRMVQEMMGHRSPSTTAGYVAYSPEVAARAMAAMRGAA